MAWTYTYEDIQDIRRKIKAIGDDIRRVDQFKKNVESKIGRRSEGANSNTPMAVLLKTYNASQEGWEGADADKFREKLGEIIQSLEQDTEEFAARMETEVKEMQSANACNIRLQQMMMDNLKPQDVLRVMAHYAGGDFDD